MIIALITTRDSYIDFIGSGDNFENAWGFRRKDSIGSIYNPQNAWAIRSFRIFEDIYRLLQRTISAPPAVELCSMPETILTIKDKFRLQHPEIGRQILRLTLLNRTRFLESLQPYSRMQSGFYAWYARTKYKPYSPAGWTVWIESL